MNAQQVIEILLDDSPEASTQDLINALEDGEALEALGFTDEDQDAIENAWAMLKDKVDAENKS